MKTYHKIFIIAFLSLLPFFIFEIILRVAHYKKEFPYRDDPDLGYCLQENYNGPGPELLGISGHNHLEVNAAGFRGKPISVMKPSHVTRVVALGDSCTFGLGLEIDQTYAYLLEGMLNEHLRADRTFEVINTGVPGYTSFQGLQMLKTRVFGLHPNLVTVYFGWNDHWYSERGRPDNEDFPEMAPIIRQRMENIRHNPLRASRTYQYLTDTILRLQDQARHKAIKPKPDSERYRVPLPLYRENLKQIISLCHEKQIPVLVITAPHGFEKGHIPVKYLIENLMKRDDSLIALHESYVAATKAVAAENGAFLLDMAIFFDETNRQNLMELDGIHPNAAGHRIIAREIAKMVQSIQAKQIAQASRK